jgi:hypothetical protein
MGTTKLMAQRYATYVALRDAGINRIDAGVAVGVSDVTRAKYERSYAKLRKIPTVAPNMHLRM